MDLKIDENKLLQHVTEIKGDAYFRNSLATELTNLKSIGGGAFFHNSNIQRADALEYVGKNLVVDEKLKRLVANIAAYYSSSSMSSTVAVNYTLVKNIKKIPGGKPGKVIINNYKTVYVDPDYNLFKDFILK